MVAQVITPVPGRIPGTPQEAHAMLLIHAMIDCPAIRDSLGDMPFFPIAGFCTLVMVHQHILNNNHQESEA
jgi:hypothetical protein